MIIDLSILLPTYNNVCLPQVKELQRQAEATCGLRYEIIVADDGSTDAEIVIANRTVNLYEHCRFMACGENRGRACIRNYLAQQAQGEWLLFADSNMKMDHDGYFLARREVLLRHPFDERFRYYGYEDVLWGKALMQHGWQIYSTRTTLIKHHYEKKQHPAYAMRMLRHAHLHDIRCPRRGTSMEG